MKRFSILCAVLICISAQAMDFDRVLIAPDAHKAIQSAAMMMAEELGASIEQGDVSAPPARGTLLLTTYPLTEQLCDYVGRENPPARDGYLIRFQNGAAAVCGTRPRSLLYADGDLRKWKSLESGLYRREPEFAIRSVERHGDMPIAEYVAKTGLNLLIERDPRVRVSMKEAMPELYEQLDDETKRRLERDERLGRERANPLADECHDADVDCYAFLYGNIFSAFSRELYQAAVKAYPEIKGTPYPNSWEKGELCPSSPLTWKLFDAYLREYMRQTKTDGLYATFWDSYGIYCRCEKCRASGMDKFPPQLAACVGQYSRTLKDLGKGFIMRTWSSGVPHWYKDDWVNAPGYGGLSLTGEQLWGPAMEASESSAIFQTKVYNSDCEPAPPFSPLLGNANGHTEIAEWQMTGQTTGRYYFPASTVRHTRESMRKSAELIGPSGGVCLFLGGTHQSNYSLLNDILNSANWHAWREFSWDLDAGVEDVLADWAAQLYAPDAAPYIAKLYDESENCVNNLFATLGFGTSTNSDFAGNIARRETLMRYTNRHILDEYKPLLEPTAENVERVVAEKAACRAAIERMWGLYEMAKPALTPAQAKEIELRMRWFDDFATCKTALEESFFRYRYLCYLKLMLTTDTAEFEKIQQAFEVVRQNHKKLFAFEDGVQFSCYDRPLEQLERRPSLGSPVPLMRDILESSGGIVADFIGPLETNLRRD
ncbi:MAG: hypothetical protein AB7F23_05615 [Phycisphaerae bacterium]|jgi:hypothetical protein